MDCFQMTGRKGRVVTTSAGTVEYEARNDCDVALELLNLTEKQRFMDGEKLVSCQVPLVSLLSVIYLVSIVWAHSFYTRRAIYQGQGGSLIANPRRNWFG